MQAGPEYWYVILLSMHKGCLAGRPVCGTDLITCSTIAGTIAGTKRMSVIKAFWMALMQVFSRSSCLLLSLSAWISMRSTMESNDKAAWIVSQLQESPSLAYTLQINDTAAFFKGEFQDPNTHLQLPLQVCACVPVCLLWERVGEIDF